MKFESGLSYKQLKAIADADAIHTLSKGSVKQVGERFQFVLNYQVYDPKTEGKKRQCRVTKFVPVEDAHPTGRGAKSINTVKKKLLPQWREQVIRDAESISGVSIDATNTTRKVIEDWIVQATRRKKKPIRESTASNYRQIAKRIFRYPLADMPLVNLNTKLVQSMLDDLAKDDEKHGRKGLSHKSLKDTHALLSLVCSDALGADKNPCKDVELPDGQPTKRTRSGRLNILTDAGIAKAMALLDDLEKEADAKREFDAMALGVRIVFSTAMRCEEVTALRWQDVDWLEGKLRITHVIERTEVPVLDDDGQYVRDANGNIRAKYVERDSVHQYANADRHTKTKKSRRNLPIDASILSLLEKRKNVVAKQIRSMPRDERPSIGDLYILGGIDGSFLSPRVLGKRWLKFATENDVHGINGEPCSIHGIRHTMGSALAKRENTQKVSAFMGHSSVRTTEKYYIQMDENAISDVGDVASSIISSRPIEGVTPIDEHDRYTHLKLTGTDG